MKNMRTKWMLPVPWVAWASLSACVSTELEVPAQSAADPAASGEPVAPASDVLRTDFDPFESYSTESDQPSNSAHPHHGGAEPGAKQVPPTGAWTCSMHPQVRRSEPGRCPICGMALVPVRPAKGAKP